MPLPLLLEKKLQPNKITNYSNLVTLDSWQQLVIKKLTVQC